MRGLSYVLTAFLVFLLSAGGYLIYEGMTFLNSTPGQTQELVFEVRSGEGFSAVARRLEKQRIVSSSLKFRLYARALGLTAKLRIGEYALHGDMYPNEVIRVLTSGRSVERRLTFQEGLNRYEIAKIVGDSGIVSESEFLRATENPELIRELLGESQESLEGYLFPETYSVTKYTTAQELIRVMVDKFKAEYQSAKRHMIVKGFSRHQIVTFASIVEKETGVSAERPVISSVFHNRLKKRMRLQTDPTVLYGILDETKVMPTNITKRDLRKKTRYNTYRFRGLPPGPISNPGRESLKYSMMPAHTDYLYFVSRNDGTHVFSKNYKDHQRAVNRFQKNAAARRGKSWRNINNKSQN